MRFKKALALGLFFSSLFYSTTSLAQNWEKEMLKGRENDSVFIIKKSGLRVSGKVITSSKKSVWRINEKDSWVAIDGKKIDFINDPWVRKQTENYYCAPYKMLYQFRDSVAYRIRYGKINLYYYIDRFQGNGIEYTVYVIEKGNSPLLEVNYENFENAIKDNNEALQLLKRLYPKSKIPDIREGKKFEYLTQIVELYNK